MTQIEFLYDFASPNCYVAYHKLKEMTKKRGLDLRLSPVFLGGLFQITNDGPVPRGSHEYNYMVENLERISRMMGIAFNFPHSTFPINSVRALRGSYFAESENRVQDYVTRVFEEYWARSTNISDLSNLGRIIETLGFDRGRFFDFIEQNETKLRLRKDTEKAYEKGVFGAPTYFIDGQMYWGTPEVLWYLNEQLAIRGTR